MKTLTLTTLFLALTLSACGAVRPSAAQTVVNALAAGQGEGMGAVMGNAMGELLSWNGSFRGVRSQALEQAVQAQSIFPACFTTPGNPTDTDGDGIPDNATYTLNCTRSGSTFSTTRTGTWTVTDPTSNLAVKTFVVQANTTVEALDKTTGVSTKVTRAGRFNPTASGNVLSFANIFSSAVEVSNQPKASMDDALSVTLTGDAPIDFSKPIGAGNIAVKGSLTYERSDVGKLQYDVSTLTPLRYDPTCDAELQIVSGVLKLDAINGSSAGTLRVIFGACGTVPRVVGGAVNL